MLNYCLLGVEGSHDQAAVARMLKLSNFSTFNGDSKKLDPFWEKLIPKYPKHGDLYKRLDMPTILTSSTHSIAIYSGEGSNLTKNLVAIATNYDQYMNKIQAFGLIVDADHNNPEKVAQKKANELRSKFPMVPDKPGTISNGVPRTGIYVLPNNKREGVLDSILVESASIAYPDHNAAAKDFINTLDRVHTEHFRPFDRDKAHIASIVSILRPGSSNTSSIAQDEWIGQKTISAIDDLAKLHTFLKDLLGLDNE